MANRTETFPPGRISALTGPSGAGKSTLLYLLALLQRPTSGLVLWDGVPAQSLGDTERSRIRATRVGFVFQDALLDPARTVLDNVCEAALYGGMPRLAAVERARELMARFGVAHREEHRPGEISGGQAQRVALCRALLTNPEVVFADEPTGNLDQQSAGVVWGALRAHADSGATVIVSTHDPALVAASDHVVQLGGAG